MTDKKLIQALRCDGYNCGVCPCFDECEPDSGNRAPALAAVRMEALIAENERLKTALDSAKVAEMPEGKPGDYVEWDNGTGFRRYIAIDSVVFCWDCVRYQLDELCPVVDHHNIVRIVKRAEMQRMIKEKWEKEGDGNG